MSSFKEMLHFINKTGVNVWLLDESVNKHASCASLELISES